MKTSAIDCIFHGNLAWLLPPEKQDGAIRYPLRRRASIKDIIESLGVPHTEVGAIEKNGQQLPFSHIAAVGESFDIYPFDTTIPALQPTVLRPIPFSSIMFMVDDTVRRLGRHMRMAGLDTAMAPAGRLRDIAALATSEGRILVSRNRELLKCRDVRFGQLVRSEYHLLQLQEVICRYTFPDRPQPFSRCLECNTILKAVKKEEIIDRLEPLTTKYYFTFKQCSACRKIYWHGSHMEEMEKVLASISCGERGK